MSHLNDFESVATDQEALIRALCRMGFTRAQIEVHETAQRINGYHVEDDKVGHIIIRKQHSNIPSDIGWEKNEDGIFVGHVDSYNYSWVSKARHYNEKFNNELFTYYNVEKMKMDMEGKGIEYKESLDAKGRPMLVGKFKVKSTGIQCKL